MAIFDDKLRQAFLNFLTAGVMDHWHENYSLALRGELTDDHIGAGKCLYCSSFFFQRFDHGNCSGCPIRKATGRKFCHGSPYWNVAAIINPVDNLILNIMGEDEHEEFLESGEHEEDLFGLPEERSVESTDCVMSEIESLAQFVPSSAKDFIDPEKDLSHLQRNILAFLIYQLVDDEASFDYTGKDGSKCYTPVSSELGDANSTFSILTRSIMQ